MYNWKIYAVLAMNPQVVYLLFVCLSLIGIAMLSLAVREIIRTIRFLRASLRAEGTVVRLDPYRNSEGSIKHLAVVSFKAFDNRIHEIRASIAHTPPSLELGTIITVRYLPDSPQKGKIENFWEIWESSLSYFVIFFAMLFFVSIITLIIFTV